MENWYEKIANEYKLDDGYNFEHLSEELKSNTFKMAGFEDVKKRSLKWTVISIAASITIAFLVFLYHFKSKSTSRAPVVVKASTFKKDILPGGNRAVLRLANGKVIDLTSERNGQIAIEGKTLINKTSDGQLNYSSSSNTAVVWNNITTPRGGAVYDRTSRCHPGNFKCSILYDLSNKLFWTSTRGGNLRRSFL